MYFVNGHYYSFQEMYSFCEPPEGLINSIGEIGLFGVWARADLSGAEVIYL